MLFDLDGTLIDHFRAIHGSLAHAARAGGLPQPSLEAVHAAVGGGIENTVRTLFGAEAATGVLAAFRPHFEETMLAGVDPLPGCGAVPRALRRRGVRTAVFTNKTGTAARRICAHLGIEDAFDAVVGAGDTPWHKPEPAFTRHVLGVLGVAPGGVVMVGDSPWDGEAARLGGLRFLAVATGTHDAGDLRRAGAEDVYAGLPELARGAFGIEVPADGAHA